MVSRSPGGAGAPGGEARVAENGGMLLFMLRWALFLLATLAGGQVPPSPADLNRVVAGTVAPDFELPSAADGNVKLSSLRGQIVVLVFYRGYW